MTVLLLVVTLQISRAQKPFQVDGPSKILTIYDFEIFRKSLVG